MADVTYEQDGAVGTLTLDKPPANSYDLDYMKEFGAAVDEAIGNDARAVIVRSASEKFFCAGADIKRFLENDVDGNMEMIRTSHATFERMEAASTVFLAQIAGHALGGGLEIALACDLRYAAEGSYKLGTPEVTLGLLPGNGGTQRISRLLGPGKGLEFLLTGTPVSVQEAADLGLVNQVFAADELDAKVRGLADGFAAGPGLAIGFIKRAVNEGLQTSLSEGLALERELMEELFRSHDANEGLNAFVEKRKPEFTGA
jgi:enoyl-CoA hydratase/carnithine racemase